MTTDNDTENFAGPHCSPYAVATFNVICKYMNEFIIVIYFYNFLNF